MNASTLASQYFAMWNEADADARAAIIEQTWAPDGAFTDPSFEVTGHEGLTKMVETAHQMFPGHAFSLTGQVEEHHNRLRWSWHLAAPGRQPVAGGTDVVTLAEDGRIGEVVGFLDFAPAGH
jgi:SnoaL-like protein